MTKPELARLRELLEAVQNLAPMRIQIAGMYGEPVTVPTALLDYYDALLGAAPALLAMAERTADLESQLDLLQRSALMRIDALEAALARIAEADNLERTYDAIRESLTLIQYRLRNGGGRPQLPLLPQ